MNKIRHYLLLILAFSFISPVFGNDLKQVDQLIRATVDQVLSVIHNKELNADKRVEKVMEIVTPVFDFPLMAKLTLGKNNWPKLSAKQKEKFTGLFITQLRESYLGNVEMVADEKIMFEAPINNDDKAHMMTRVITKEDPIGILYKLYFEKNSKKWRVYDVEIQGISIIKSYGMQYDQILQTGTVETLLKKMKELAEQNDKEKAAVNTTEKKPLK
jgi:phospholipid transport system substrate-binding protein